MTNTQVAEAKAVKAHHHSVHLMGCHFVVTAVDENPNKAWIAIRTAIHEMERIEKLISSWDDNSETSKINMAAGIHPVQVCQELWGLIERSQRVSVLTAGAFDISGTLSRDFWKFDKGCHDSLSSEEIKKLRGLIDYRKIVLNKKMSSVFLKSKGMKIGFGGIGKGYAAYRAYKVMENLGIKSGLVNASGDLMCWGSPPNKILWDVSVLDPDKADSRLFQISIPFGSVVTSGSNENFTIVNGERLSHIVDPRTAMPVKWLKSVSVVCPNPELADALATALSVLGPHDGLDLINKLDGVECLIIDTKGKLFLSDHFRHVMN